MKFTKKQIEKKYNVILKRASAGLDFDYPAWLAYSNDEEHEQLAYEDTLSDIAVTLDKIRMQEEDYEEGEFIIPNHEEKNSHV